MAKQEVYWFKHDGNARRDMKILEMMSVYGYEGYGWYWAILEMMREASDYKLKYKGKFGLTALAMELKEEPSKIQQYLDDCLNEFGLFVSEGEYFWSNSMLRRMKAYNNVLDARAGAANSRWGTNPDANPDDIDSRQKRSQRLMEARKKGKHTKEDWEEMKAFFNNTCVKCNGKTNLNGVVKDHIMPIYQGGSDGIENIQPLCAKCNASKGPEAIDYRPAYCFEYKLEMPAKWLQNTC